MRIAAGLKLLKICYRFVIHSDLKLIYSLEEMYDIYPQEVDHKIFYAPSFAHVRQPNTMVYQRCIERNSPPQGAIIASCLPTTTSLSKIRRGRYF